jgi:hypothetical protein
MVSTWAFEKIPAAIKSDSFFGVLVLQITPLSIFLPV